MHFEGLKRLERIDDVPDGPRRRVVAIVTRRAQSDLVLARLCQSHDVVHVIRPVSGPLRWDLFRAQPWQVARKKLAGWRTRRHKQHVQAAAAQRFAGQFTLPEGLPETEVVVHLINSLPTRRLIDAAQPEILFVCGSPVLDEAVFGIPAIGTINLHLGITPFYRGENGHFWALRHQNPDALGFTFHRIDAGIDTGPVLAFGLPALAGKESETDTLLAATGLAARIAGRVVAECAPGSGHALASGHYYPSTARTPFRELQGRVKPWYPPAREESVWS